MDESAMSESSFLKVMERLVSEQTTRSEAVRELARILRTRGSSGNSEIMNAVSKLKPEHRLSILDVVADAIIKSRLR